MPSLKISEFEKYLERESSFTQGCILDTNILFAATFSDDYKHDLAAEIVNCLIKKKIPLFINVNIRAEFINLALRVVVPQALCGIFRDFGTVLPEQVYKQLKSINQLVQDGIRDGKLFKLQDRRIKEVRSLLSKTKVSNETIWDLFCETYLKGKLASEWSLIEKDLKLEFLSLRFDEDSKHMRDQLLWSDAITIMERTAVGSADAMIVNLFDKSKYTLMASLDEDISYAIEHLGMDDKFLIC